ncbi:hypothetical protein BDN71DRAFT_1390343 [Pleurotus eryngii]|uniref:MICOS complex subunit mic19 n=1 Tax=Pleurotus eryngii TaxID=5323 RepID=A0A9P6D982_PLEER|nr:hypothetical protein BDN71DRAFT_1390343 [Pleurotus eryngii]
MGGSQSRVDSDDNVYQPETSIQFSPAVVSQLSDHAAAPGIPPERQSTLDHHVRSRIQAELAHLRAEEEDVRSQIERALEKENLDKERAMAGGGLDAEAREAERAEAGVKSAVTLLGDLDEIQEKVLRSKQKQNAPEIEAAHQASAAVLSCYQNNATSPLDCWKQVSNFKQSIAHLEQVRSFPTPPSSSSVSYTLVLMRNPTGIHQVITLEPMSTTLLPQYPFYCSIL